MRLGVLLLLGAFASTASAQRATVSINDGWRFWNDDASGAEAAGFDDTPWARVDLPHTWNAEDAFDATPGYRRGVGWYRRTLRLGDEHAGKRIYLYFEGANQVADVWVNGQPVGGHVGGYTAFALDVTEAVRSGDTAEGDGAANVVAVRVDNAHDPDIPPLDADFTFYGGIYRDVWLVAVEPVHFSLADAAPGVRLDTPDITSVRARTHVDNDGDAPATVTVTHRLLDPEGTEVATWSASGTVGAGESAVLEAWSDEVPDLQLYTPETPAVYRVHSRLDVDGTEADRETNPLGFRWVEVDGDGFLINSTRWQLIGTNRHQDVEGYGNAVPDALHRRDVQIVRETGFEFLRLAHYPQDPAVLSEADRLGLLVWEEIPVVNTITQSEAFAENAERMLREMIRQHYNHPSVVIWGYMNEILLRIPDPMPDGYIEDVRALAERLEDVVEAEDPYRLTAMAVSFNEAEYRIADASDIFAFNLYFGWYHDTFADLGVFLDSLHAAHPEVPLMLSEYGAGSDERIHADRPVRFDFSTEHAEDFHRASLRTVQERPWLVGSAVWNQFDFGSAGRQDTKDGINQKGLYFFDRTPKDVAFLYRAALRTRAGVFDGHPARLGEPLIRVERDHPHRAGPRRQRVRVFSNAQTVGLRLGGRPVGTAMPEDGLAVFEVDLEPGENRIEAVGAWATPGTHADATTLYYTDTAAFFTGGPEAPSAVALNVGADHRFTGAGGLVYVAEADWPGDLPASGRARRTHHRIDGTDEDARFQTYREMPASWALPRLPAGTYDLTLGFAEMAEPGRAFAVTVEGAAPTALPVDLAASGRWTAVEKTVRFTLPEAGAPVLRFDAASAPAVLSTLVLRRL